MPTRTASKETGAAFVCGPGNYLTKRARFWTAPAAPLAATPQICWSRTGICFRPRVFCDPLRLFFQRLKKDRRGRRRAPQAFRSFTLFVASLNVVCTWRRIFTQLFDGHFSCGKLRKPSVLFCRHASEALWSRRRLFEQVRTLAAPIPTNGVGELSDVSSDFLEAEVGPFPPHAESLRVCCRHGRAQTQINDQYGHLPGKPCVGRIGKISRNHYRAMTPPARYGGDEFAWYYGSGTRHLLARLRFSRIRERISAEPERLRGGQWRESLRAPRTAIYAENFLAAPDRALYAMKTWQEPPFSKSRARSAAAWPA